jgi:hypothetical protein
MNCNKASFLVWIDSDKLAKTMDRCRTEVRALYGWELNVVYLKSKADFTILEIEVRFNDLLDKVAAELKYDSYTLTAYTIVHNIIYRDYQFT